MSLKQPFSKSSDDERLTNRATSARGDRLASEREYADDRENSDSARRAERFATLSDVMTILPTPPDIPGYHTCWLTTNNTRDSLEHRFRIGYALVHPDELPGFCLPSQKDDTLVSDRITVNEMVLAKIPLNEWEENVLHLHHTKPTQEVQALKEGLDIFQDGRGNNVAYTGEGFKGGKAEGYNLLGRNAKPTLAGLK